MKQTVIKGDIMNKITKKKSQYEKMYILVSYDRAMKSYKEIGIKVVKRYGIECLVKKRKLIKIEGIKRVNSKK